MSKKFLITSCKECPIFMWEEGDTGGCMDLSPPEVNPDAIDPRCPLPDDDTNKNAVELPTAQA